MHAGSQVWVFEEDEEQIAADQDALCDLEVGCLRVFRRVLSNHALLFMTSLQQRKMARHSRKNLHLAATHERACRLLGSFT